MSLQNTAPRSGATPLSIESAPTAACHCRATRLEERPRAFAFDTHATPLYRPILPRSRSRGIDVCRRGGLPRGRGVHLASSPFALRRCAFAISALRIQPRASVFLGAERGKVAPGMIQLTPDESRVFGVLIEKALTTPEQYPLSLNAIVNGANQKNNRDPVVTMTEDAAFDAAEG